MKKFTTVAAIAALSIATQAFAMGGSTKGGQSMRSTMSGSSMKTGSMMRTGTHSMTAAGPMSGAAAMTAPMSGMGTPKTEMTHASTVQPAAAK